MKNKHEVLGLFANIFAVILLLAFIIVGLNRIGIYKLPKPVEKLLGTHDDEIGMDSGNDDMVFEIIDSHGKDAKILTVDLDYLNAKKILEELSVSHDYSHDVTVKHYFDKNVREQKISVNRKNGLYDVSVSENKILVKNIKETDEGAVISFPAEDVNDKLTVSKGNFDIAEECGFILNVDEFLLSGFILDEASFSQYSNENGYFLSVIFDSSMNDITYNQKYVISLDYGIVTEVHSYEQGSLVYEMTTDALSLNH